MTNSQDTRTVLKDALLQMRQMRQKIETLQRAHNDPIAVIGLGCRFPHAADSPQRFWQNLQNGTDSITPIPADRWDVEAYFDPNPDTPGKSTVRHGGFIQAVDQFDPQFFGISPREAAAIDPQQRLLLELAWEALEHAAIVPETLRGSKTAVYIGQSADDYAQLSSHSAQLNQIDAYTSLGSHRSIAAGRIAYWLGLHGVTLQLDTACSSSLLAIHLAVQSLRQKESDLALAGGVNLMLTPNMMVGLSKLKALSPDGRCHTFDATANGYGRGEGGGLVVLKRLTDAQAAGDNILAVIRGSATNHDGQSNGLTAPNGQAQIALLQQALDDAELRPNDIQYIEAHGTGTPLGDPIEVQALGKVLGNDRTLPLKLGTVKTNIGHLESAAGIAGFIKTVLALHHQQIPANLNFKTPNPHIDWAKLPVEVVTALTPWPAGENGRFAGVSSFGMSGTNVHVILGGGETPSQPTQNAKPQGENLLLLSAKSLAALRQAAVNFADYLSEATAPLQDICATAALGRTHFTHRLAMLGADSTTMEQQLRQYALGLHKDQESGVIHAESSQVKPATADDEVQALTRLGQRYIAGLSINLPDLSERSAAYSSGGRLSGLPTYPFQRERYWLDQTSAVQHAPSNFTWRQLPLPGADGSRFEQNLSEQAFPFLAQHRLFESAIAPAALFIEWALRAAENKLPVCIESFAIEQPLIVPEDGVQTAQVVLAADGRFEIYSCGQKNGPAHEAVWAKHVQGQVLPLSGPAFSGENELSQLQKTIIEPVDVAEFYAGYQQKGVTFGPTFQAVKALWCGTDQALAFVHASSNSVPSRGRYFDPVLLDACTQIVAAALPLSSTDLFIQVGLDRFCLYQPPPAEIWSHASLIEQGDDTFLVNLRLYTADGSLVASADGLLLKRVNETRRAASADVFYKLDWEPLDLPEPLVPTDFVPSPSYLKHNISPVWSPELDWGLYEKSMGLLNQFAYQQIVVAFDQLGCAWQIGDRFTADQIIEHCHIIPRYRRLVARLLAILGEFRLLKLVDETWHVISLASTDQSLTISSVAHSEFSLLSRCTAALPAVLQGKVDPVQILFPQGDVTDAAHLYRDSMAAQLMNQLVCDGVREAIAQLPTGRTLRILEIGAGTGGTTSIILPHLPPSQTRYLFTDIGELLTDQARHMFGHYDFIEYQHLDIEQPFTDASLIEPGQFDLVIAANVLHATRHLHQSLRHTHQLLAPQGLLVLLEGSRPQPWLDLIFGLTDGWWRFEDIDLRSSHPLLPPSAWHTVLNSAGFSSSIDISPADWLGQALIIAQAAPEIWRSSGQWIIVADDIDQTSVGANLVQQLADAGCQSQLVPDNVDFLSLFKNTAADLPFSIVHLSSLTKGSAGTRSALALTQALIETDYVPADFLLVSQGAQMTTANPHQAALWGFGRVLAQEHPELNSRLLDLDSNSIDPAANLLTMLHLGQTPKTKPESEIVLRQGQPFTPRLGRMRLSTAELPMILIKPDASYLVTGGLGGLGLLTAGWLVEHGAKNLWLVGRSAPTEAVQAQLDTWTAAGIAVHVRQVDVAQADPVEALFAEIKATGKPFRGLIHAAGSYADSLIRDHRWELFEEVFAAKVQGGWHLHSQSKDLALDFFALFSTASTLLGGVGLANYVAANSFLDALARYRQQNHLPALSLNWGPWGQTGMAQSVGQAREQQWANWGITPMSPDESLAAFGRMLFQPESNAQAQAAIMQIDWDRFGRQTAVVPTLLAGLIEKSTHTPAIASILPDLARLPEGERPTHLQTHIQKTAAQILGFASADALNPSQGFFEMGMDSLMATELRNRLQATLDCVLSPTLTFKFPNVHALSTYLEQLLWDNIPQPVPALPVPKDKTNMGQPQSKTDIYHMDEAELTQFIDDELAKLFQ